MLPSPSPRWFELFSTCKMSCSFSAAHEHGVLEHGWGFVYVIYIYMYLYK